MSTAHAALQGLRVLVTRPAHQSAALSARLRVLGAVPIELPVIEIAPLPADEIEQLLAGIESYDWIIFTSVNTVSVVGPYLADKQRVPDIAVIGSATASAVEELGLPVELLPDEFVAESVLESMLELDVEGKRILLPRAEVARDTLPDGLRAGGAHVDAVAVYRTRLPDSIDSAIVAGLQAGEVDIVTFTSPSTVENLLTILDGQFPEDVRIACIGPVTARAVERAGLTVDIMAREYSIPGLVQALVEDGQL